MEEELVTRNFAANLLGFYIHSAEFILWKAENSSQEINHEQMRKFRDNYQFYLEKCRGVIEEEEARVHENTIGRLEQYFEITDT